MYRSTTLVVNTSPTSYGTNNTSTEKLIANTVCQPIIHMLGGYSLSWVVTVALKTVCWSPFHHIDHYDTSIVRCTVTALINSGLHCHTGRPGMSAIVRWPLLFLQDTHNCSDAGSCVCTPLNKCYRRKQVLYVDHRWLNRSAGHAIQITADVFNHVGLSTTTKVKVRSHYPIFCYYSCLSGRCRFH